MEPMMQPYQCVVETVHAPNPDSFPTEIKYSPYQSVKLHKKGGYTQSAQLGQSAIFLKTSYKLEYKTKHYNTGSQTEGKYPTAAPLVGKAIVHLGLRDHCGKGAIFELIRGSAGPFKDVGSLQPSPQGSMSLKSTQNSYCNPLLDLQFLKQVATVLTQMYKN